MARDTSDSEILLPVDRLRALISAARGERITENAEADAAFKAALDAASKKRRADIAAAQNKRDAAVRKAKEDALSAARTAKEGAEAKVKELAKLQEVLIDLDEKAEAAERVWKEYEQSRKGINGVSEAVKRKNTALTKLKEAIADEETINQKRLAAQREVRGKVRGGSSAKREQREDEKTIQTLKAQIKQLEDQKTGLVTKKDEINQRYVPLRTAKNKALTEAKKATKGVDGFEGDLTFENRRDFIENVNEQLVQAEKDLARRSQELHDVEVEAGEKEKRPVAAFIAANIAALRQWISKQSKPQPQPQLRLPAPVQE